MDEPRTQRFLIVETDAKYAAWTQHAIGAGWPNDSVVIMDWTSFGRVRTAMTVRDGLVYAVWDIANPDKFTGSPLRGAASL